MPLHLKFLIMLYSTKINYKLLAAMKDFWIRICIVIFIRCNLPTIKLVVGRVQPVHSNINQALLPRPLWDDLWFVWWSWWTQIPGHTLDLDKLYELGVFFFIFMVIIWLWPLPLLLLVALMAIQTSIRRNMSLLQRFYCCNSWLATNLSWDLIFLIQH